MPNFNGIVLTNNGATLLAKAQQGKELCFSKMVLGSADDISNPKEKTAVTTPFMTTNIRSIDVTTDGNARISTYITNAELTQSYVWREIGLFALDPDTREEILYAYKCAGANGETIPAGGGSDIIEKIFDIIIRIQNATNISAIIDGSTVFISRQEVLQNLEDCENEQYKVPSAKLFFSEINKTFSSDHIKTFTFSVTLPANVSIGEGYEYPSGWSRDNCVIIGYQVKKSSDDMYDHYYTYDKDMYYGYPYLSNSGVHWTAINSSNSKVDLICKITVLRLS